MKLIKWKMKIRERVNHWIPKLLGVDAIVLYPFVLYRTTPSKALVRHEMKHIEQVESNGFFRFYMSYIVYTLSGVLQGKTFRQAYLDNPYEVEARKAEKITCGFCSDPCNNDWCVTNTKGKK